MKTKILYVLVSSDGDCYLEQAYVSMCSVKHHMPDAHIVLLTDKATHNTFIGLRGEKMALADELIVIELDSQKYNAQQRSRLLKTNSRNHVKGDCLYIDTDTIITKPLYEIDAIKSDLAACWDTHTTAKASPFYGLTLRDGHKLGWPVEEEDIYFNGGLMYAKDSPKAHEFYTLWHHNLQEGWKVGVMMDQPSLAKTNYMLGHVIDVLPEVWNCQLIYGMKFLRDAKIVHYLITSYADDNGERLFIMNNRAIFDALTRTNELDQRILQSFDDPFCGLPNVTQCLAGADMHYLHSQLFDLTRRLKGTCMEHILLVVLRTYYKIRRTLKLE